MPNIFSCIVLLQTQQALCDLLPYLHVPDSTCRAHEILCIVQASVALQADNEKLKQQLQDTQDDVSRKSEALQADSEKLTQQLKDELLETKQRYRACRQVSLF